MICLISGLLILYRYKVPLRFIELLPAAFLTGTVLSLIWLTITCIWQRQLNLIAIATALFLSLSTALILCWPVIGDEVKKPVLSPQELKSLIFSGIWLGLLTWAFQKMILFENHGIASVVGIDLSVHITMIQHFVNGSLFPPENPFIAGYPLIYPFAINLFSATLILLGWPLYWALTVPSLLLCACLLLLLQALTRRLTQSDHAAQWAIPLLLLNGGIGALYFACELILNISPKGIQSPHYYTDLPDLGLQWFNLIQYFLLPQRSFLLGLPVVLLILILLNMATQNKKTQTSIWVLAGLLTGSLPLLHTHSLIALGVVLPIWIGFNRDKKWRYYFGAATISGGPLIIWMLKGMQGHKSYLGHWLGGWHGWSSNTSVGIFWLSNAGILLFLLIIGQINDSTPEKLKKWTSSSQYLFILANLFLFAPHMGDNMKLFVLWYVFCIPLASLVLAQLWQRYRLLTGLCLFLLLGAGTLDVGKLLLTRRNIFTLLSEDDIYLANKIRKSFPANSVFLHAPVYYHPWIYTGHSSLMGNPSVVASYGIHPDGRLADLKFMYSSQDCKAVKTLMKKRYPHAVGFYWSQQEKDYFKIKKTCLTTLYPQFWVSGDWQVYEILPH